MSLRVLIVEDEPLISMTVVDMLEELGHSVTAVVATLASGQHEIQKETPDIALLDVGLGLDSGYCISELRRASL